jgi:outer membrane protein OmpA-like peptidoglycan-associated protein
MNNLLRTASSAFALVALWPSLSFAQEVVQQEQARTSAPKTVEEVTPEKVKEKKGKKQATAAYVSPYYTHDDDKDGIPNGRDKCPFTPQGEKVTPFGCPYDTDFDGLYDYEDKCPTEPGPKENIGCPYGDRDKDGVMDNNDKCPDEPGAPRFFGCPDTDSDGLPDHTDACPKVAGLKENKGCPPSKTDTDGDGVYDHEDICVTTPGIKANKGCPEIKEEEKNALKKAFNNLLFETGKDIIQKSSFTSLDELAQVLKNNAKAKLHLEGHTDNVGEEIENQTLSENRALAVKKYLAGKGISEDRISTNAFGENRPKASNDDEKGRALNRRVEMNIKYE